MRLLTGSGVASVVLPGRARLAAFEEREAVGVEQAAAVGRELAVVVPDAAVDGPEGGQQPAPGVVAGVRGSPRRAGRPLPAAARGCVETA